MTPFRSSLNSIRQFIFDLYEKHQNNVEGTLADYIPELTRASPEWFGIAITTVDGRQYFVGDTSVEFTIQSVSKPFIYGLAIEEQGLEHVRSKIDVEPSGEAFNSISLNPDTGQPRNPMINAGAIAATGLIGKGTMSERFTLIRERFGAFAGRDLNLDESVYQSESRTGFRNRAIANLLRNFDIIEGDVDPILEAYFMQCALLVDCGSLSVMGATLANGGINPVTGQTVLDASTVEKVTSVMSTCGMYDFSGNWAFEVGIPAKSGVGGGIIGVLPGQLSIAVFSPLLDENFNSVRGILTFRDLSRRFGLHLLNRPSLTNYVIRRSYTLSDYHSNRFRPRRDEEILKKEGKRVRVFELQGDLHFSAIERLIHAYLQAFEGNERVVIDLSRTGSIDAATRVVLFQFAGKVFESGKRLAIVDPGGIFTAEERRSLVPMAFVYDDCNESLQDAEENLLAQYGIRPDATVGVDFAGMELLSGMSEAGLRALEELSSEHEHEAGATIIAQDAPSDEIFLLAKGIVGVEFRSGDDSPAKQVSSFSPGMAFGELSFLQGQKRTADVVAVDRVVVHALSRESIDTFRKDFAGDYEIMLLNIVQSMSERLVRANLEVAELR